MSEHSVIIWDLETVPDLAAAARLLDEGCRVDALGAPHTGERSEGQLIRDFIEKIGQLRSQLVTFNGHSFDLPVLRYRAMVNRVPAVGLQVRQVLSPLHGGRARPLRRAGLVCARREGEAR